MKKLFVAMLVFAMLCSGCGKQEKASEKKTAPSVPETAVVTDSVQETEQVTEPVAEETRYQVNNPKARPDYSVSENPTTDELRATALQAMQDFVTLAWTPDKYYTYKNPYDIVNKQFQFVPEVTFGGLPYTNAHTGLFQWYAYYDAETGIMSYPGDGMEWSANLGSVCADTILWSWSTVVNSIGGRFNTFTMTPEYGFIPVGDYVIPEGVLDYREYPTDRICSDNGMETILEAYTQVLPADALVSTPDGHAVMVVKLGEVVRNADGTIDAEKSTIFICDQRGGTGNYFYEEEINGETLLLSGRSNYEYTFAKLYKLGYIPVTCEEFIGVSGYEKPEITFEGSADSLNQFLSGSLKCQYLLATLEAVDAQTGERLAIALYRKNDTVTNKGCDGFTYDLQKLQGLEAEAGTTVKIVATLATGHQFTITEITV